MKIIVIMSFIANINPALVILDVSDNKDLSELSICSKIKMKNSKINSVSSIIMLPPSNFYQIYSDNSKW